MPLTDMTEDQIARDLTLAGNRKNAASDWLHRASEALEAARSTYRAADAAIEEAADDDESTPAFAALYIATCEADAAVKAAVAAHRSALQEFEDWDRLVFDLREALDIKRGGPGYEL